MSEPLSPDTSRWIELWFRGYSARLHNLQDRLRRLAAVEPRQRRSGGPRGPRTIQTLDEFEALLREVMRWLEKDFAAVPKWRIVNSMYFLSIEPRPERLHKLPTVDPGKMLDEAAKQWWRRCENAFGVDLNELIEDIRRDLWGP